MRRLVYIVLSSCLFFSFFSNCTDNPDEKTASQTPTKDENYEDALFFIDSLLSKNYITLWDSTASMPDQGSVKLKINYPGGTLKEIFKDTNDLHYASGQALGIKPLSDDIFDPIEPLYRQLERVSSNKYYYIDELRHSYPYLIPESHALLEEIAKRFHDTLQVRGGGPYRLKVTSLLRTSDSVAKLRRVNNASVDSSAHLFGATFDISFTNFPYSGGEPHRTQEDLKNLLAEILYEIRAEGRCYIIYEHRPGCFHITVRPKEG